MRMDVTSAAKSCDGLSLVLPAYNEEAVIGDAIGEAAAALPNVVARHEILVVDDGSRDQTYARARREAARHPHVRVLRHDVNRGYGAALRTGFESAAMPLVAFTDADCQFDLADLGRMIPLAQSHPIVVGHRIDRKDSLRRRIYSRGYNCLVRTLLRTGVRDVDCALKVFHADVLGELLPQSTGFFVNAEMLTRARKKGHSIAEIGVAHRPRRGGESKVSILDVPRVLRVLIPFWWSGGTRTLADSPSAPTLATEVAATEVAATAARRQAVAQNRF